MAGTTKTTTVAAAYQLASTLAATGVWSTPSALAALRQTDIGAMAMKPSATKQNAARQNS
jgi:hypothetical protein